MAESENPKGVKLLMTYDIMPGREQDYFEFNVREFLPGMQAMGLEPSDAWYTTFGSQPQFLIAAKADTLAAMEKLLTSSDWATLTNRLLDYVINFKLKIVEWRTRFQL